MGEIPASVKVVLEYWTECEECGRDGYTGDTWYKEIGMDPEFTFCSRSCINEHLQDKYKGD